MVVAIVAAVLWCVLPAAAQVVPPVIDPTGRSGEAPPLQKEVPPKPAPPAPVLPPPALQEPLKQKLPTIRVLVKEIRVVGSTVFSKEEIDTVIKPYINRELTTEDLQEIRRALTLLYVNNGYVNSGAIIPDQTVKEGIITFQIIEGELSDVEVEGTIHFFPFYLEQRIQLSAGPPLNVNRLRERLQLFLQDERFKRVNAELKPGLQPGQGVLHLKVEEASPYKAWVEFNNFQSPTVGAERGLATVQHLNLVGFGDIFSFTYGRSEGLNPQIDASYVLPISPYDTTAIFQLRKNDFSVIEAPFDTLNITQETDIFHITLRQPLHRSPTSELAVALTGERLRNQVFLSGIGTNLFSPGAAPNGESVVSALRLAQEWVQRQPSQVIALRSRFSMGIDVLGATNLGKNTPDTRFFPGWDRHSGRIALIRPPSN